VFLGPFAKFKMGNPKIKICLFFCFSLAFFLMGNVNAEIIRLKSGKSVEGKIIEKTNDYLKVDVGGVAVTYFNDDLEKPEAPRVSRDTVTATQFAQESLGELYVNEEHGFEIRGPKGWFKNLGRPNSGPAVIFTRHLYTGQMRLPILGVTVDTAPANIATALDFANFILPQYQASADKTQAQFKLIEPPHEIEINGRKGARYVFQMLGKDRAMESIDCKFLRGNMIISIQGMDTPEAFQADLADFQEAVSSFKFREPQKVPEGTRTRALVDVLATGQKRYGKYENREPSFSLDIAKDAHSGWYFVVFNEPRAPFYIVSDATFKKNLPFISSMVSVVPADKLTENKEKIFKEVAAENEQWEKNTWAKENINFINNGSPLALNGFAAFERVLEIPNQNIKYHFVYIFLDKFLLQLGLNTTIEDYLQDDKDFMNIIRTLTAK